MRKVLKYFGLSLLSIVVLLLVLLTGRAILDKRIDYDVDLAGTEVPTFTTIELPQEHSFSDEKSLPVNGGAAIDIDGDGVDELFIGGGHGQADTLYRFSGGGFTAVSNAAGIDKPEGDSSLGALVLDVDKDGQQDLIIARPSGIWLYMNSNGSFSGQKLDAPLLDDTTAVSVAVADINADGHFDMYVSGYIRNDLIEGLNIFNKEGYGGTSALLINRGDNSFEDQTKERGLYYKHNTFQSAFIDFDNDGDLDLVVAHDTGQVRTWENDGDGHFTNSPNPTSDQFTYPMGIAIGDYDNDGLVDFFFSNVGSSPPHFLVKGDLREDQQHNWKWLLFHNLGDMKFEEVAEEARLADYEFSWGAVFEDLNLDGREDLVVSENFVSAPFHKFGFLRLPGRLLVQTPTGEFAEVGAEAGVVNNRYSISPVTSDFNNDGRPDIVHVNISGHSLVFLSSGETRNGFLKVKLSRDVSSIGAMVTIELDDGKTLSRPFVSGEGLSSDSSDVIIVGLGEQRADKVSVRYIDGQIIERSGPFRNQVVSFESQ
jgi:hypothetical protein